MASRPPERRPEKKADAPAEKPLEKPAEKPVEKPVEKPAPQNKPPEKTATFRERYERTKDDLSKAQARIAELEKKSSAPADDKPLKEVQGKLETAQKRVQELEEEFKYVNYKKHPEFKERYVKPMEEAYASGVESTKGFRVTDENGERHGTEDDFDKFMSIADNEDAWNFAEQRFGSKAAIMWTHRQNFVKSVQAKNKAIEDFRKTGSEREKQTAEQQAAASKQAAEQWSGLVKSGVEKYPHYFAPVEGDDDGNKILEQGMAMADLAFGVLAPENIDKLPAKARASLVNGQLPPAEQLKLHSAIRNMAGGFGRMKHQLSLEQAKVKDLQTRLAEYEKSEPTGGGDGGGQPVNRQKGRLTPEQEMDRIAGI